MNTVKLLALFAENKSGQLAHVTGLLAEANLNIRWVTISGADAFGVIKILLDDPEIGLRQLKHNGVPVSIVEALAIEVADKPGGLFAVAQCLAQNKINVENASGLILKDRAVLLIETTDLARAAALLQSQGLRLLTANELKA